MLETPSVFAEFVGGVMIGAHPDGDIRDADWNLALSECRKRGATRWLVFSDQAKPNAGQRARALEFFEDAGTARAAIVGGTTPFVRGTVTALTWFAGEDRFKLFGWSDVGRALEFLGLRSNDAAILAASRRVCAAAGLAADRIDAAAG